jgi:hypothetical protein
VFGLLAVTRAVLPVLRRQRAGHLVVLSLMGVFATDFGHAAARTEPIADYALPRYDGDTGGHDPGWGVAEIRRAVADPVSGLRLPLGSAAVGRIGAKLAAVRTELDTLHRVSHQRVTIARRD